MLKAILYQGRVINSLIQIPIITVDIINFKADINFIRGIGRDEQIHGG